MGRVRDGMMELRFQTDYDRLKETLPSDPEDLDAELVLLAVNQHEAGEFTALANNFKEKAEHDLEVVTAEYAQELRNTLINGKERSEARIKSEVVLGEDVHRATEAFMEAKYEYDLWKSLSDSLRSKSKGIESIVGLITSGYTTPDRIKRSESRSRRS